MKPLNLWQRAVANNYAAGDYAYVQTLEQCEEVGDMLFTFLMVELDEGEGCDSWEEALVRVQAAVEDLDQAARTLNSFIVASDPPNRRDRLNPVK